MKTQITITALVAFSISASLQAGEVYKEPHVRYLIADMTLGGSPDYYKQHAHDSIPATALKEWEAGARLMNTNRFERRRIPTPYGDSMRVVFKGTDMTVTGADLLLTSDLTFEQSPMRLVLADLTLGRSLAFYEAKKGDPNVAEALKRWSYGARVVNTNLFIARGEKRELVYVTNGRLLDGALVKLNTDPYFSEGWLRYLIAEIQLGTPKEKFLSFGHRFHDYNCLEAVAYLEAGYKVTNLDQFELKPLKNNPTVVYKGTEKRVDPFDIRLTSDPAKQ